MIYDTLSSQDAFTHKLNSYLKEYWRYTPDSMQFLETRSEVTFKVTVTQLWYATFRHPKMHLHTKFEIATSNNIRDMLRTRSGKDGQTDGAITICLPKSSVTHSIILHSSPLGQLAYVSSLSRDINEAF